MGVPPLPDGLVHPAALFHVTVAGGGLGIGEIFALFRAESDEAIRGGEFHWRFDDRCARTRPTTRAGEVIAVERKQSRNLGAMDADPCFQMRDPATAASSSPSAPDLARPADAVTIGPGTPLPPWRLDRVDPGKMKLYAAIARDPNPIHWDRCEVARRGLGERLINQGPHEPRLRGEHAPRLGGPRLVRELTFASPRRSSTATPSPPAASSPPSPSTGASAADCEVWLAATTARAPSRAPRRGVAAVAARPAARARSGARVVVDALLGDHARRPARRRRSRCPCSGCGRSAGSCSS